MVVEIKNFHFAMRLELSCLIQALQDHLERKHAVVELECKPFAASLGVDQTVHDSDIDGIREDFDTFSTIIFSHSNCEDSLIFPVLISRSDEFKEHLSGFDYEHNKIVMKLKSIRSQWDIYPFVHSEAAQLCMVEDILSQAISLRVALFLHFDNEERIMHSFMHQKMTTDEVNVIVGRVLGHRSNDVMEKILKLMYRHLTEADFSMCLENILKSVSGTFFEKWLAALPPVVGKGGTETETALSSILEKIGATEVVRDDNFQPDTTVAGVMSGSIPGELREHALDNLRKDYEKGANISVTDVILQENHRLKVTNKKRKRSANPLENLNGMEKKSEISSHSSDTEQMKLPEEDMTESYFDKEASLLGCPHYRRKCKILTPCCSRTYVCRLCHNSAVNDGHVADR